MSSKKVFYLIGKNLFLMMPSTAQKFIYGLYGLYLKLLLRRHIPDCTIYQDALRGKYGLEVGGPSFVFRAILPVYSVIEKLDGVNYSNFTKWEGSICEGMNYRWYWGKQEGSSLLNALI
tara:strand:+ start:194 stop:550 length:357 start_codon:yes stop_codon:yes gene_type:complete